MFRVITHFNFNNVTYSLRPSVKFMLLYIKEIMLLAFFLFRNIFYCENTKLYKWFSLYCRSLQFKVTLSLWLFTHTHHKKSWMHQFPPENPTGSFHTEEGNCPYALPLQHCQEGWLSSLTLLSQTPTPQLSLILPLLCYSQLSIYITPLLRKQIHLCMPI